MPRPSIKIAVTLPPDLYRTIERGRKRAGKTRSAVVQEALRGWIDRQRDIEKVQQYEAGYRRQPESDEEITTSTVLAIQSFSYLKW